MREVAEPDERRAGWGIPPSAAIPGVLVVSVAGSVFDLRVNHTLGILFGAAFVLASLAATFFVRHSGVFVAMFVPPLVLLLAAAVGVLVNRGVQGGMTAVLLAIATPVLPQFPVMAGTTAATLLIGGIRLLRHRRQRGLTSPVS
ncbi:hypothetical protein HFP15_24210 [Amycolatopsis sp. K13G38]|uniref:DUF6542 domain-containing protein n=1 Tax=Amycolatopsis acididurans TaxID=2724524 RepID=A0ABX1JCI0_9PSEU|nr:DUF6542 domain-containing protein [Amycolatopsis acididurans]NKQ55987.1 hypothetical protein [Amycolatopsis acididurans]